MDSDSSDQKKHSMKAIDAIMPNVTQQDLLIFGAFVRV